MEFAELTKLVVGRIQKLEPDNTGKIMGCILLQEPEENDMLQLAYDNDSVLLSKINDAKAMLAAIYARFSVQPGPGVHSGLHLHPISGIRHFSPETALSFHVQSQYWSDTQQAADKHTEFTQSHNVFVDSPAVEHHHYSLRSQPKQVFGLDDMAASYCYSEDAFASPPRALGRRSSGLSRRPCYYFIKGICKNGENCNYSHHHVYSDMFDGEHGTTPGSLEKLELEITEILKSRRGQPVSIASLPTLYGEKYGRGLQADGYLTESQRHGKAGYSLTKLLSRLNKIRVVERPHGQHSVVLAEDAATYTDFRCDKGDQGVIPASSHQIYLTFPAESTFTEDDVANYFGRFGPVRDVRIPCQERRMFGFVSFQSPETVTTIFMEGNPHSICGSRVLVKPYREKSKCLGRTYTDKIKPANCYPPRYFDFDPELCAGEYDHATRFMRKQLAEKHERMMEFERRRLPRLSELRLDAMPQYAYFNYSFEDFNSTQPDCKELDSADPFIFPPDSLQNVNVSTSQVPTRQANNYDDQESDQIELLPESPFSSAADGNGISRII